MQLARSVGALFFDHLGPARIQGWVPLGLRAPYAVWLHGIEVWRPLSGDRRRSLEGAGLLISNSRYTWDRAVASNAWLNQRPHHVVHLAVEDPGGNPPRVPAGDVGAPYFLMIGRLSSAERYKGHTETIEAFSRLAPVYPAARLVIVGEGDDSLRLEALAASCAPAGSIIFRGFVSDEERTALLRGCRALVLPSTGEGFGLVFIEAFQHGRPFVACSDTVAEEVAGESGAALLVPPGDPDALTSALMSLLAEPNRSLCMGAAGRKLVDERFLESAFRERFRFAMTVMDGSR